MSAIEVNVQIDRGDYADSKASLGSRVGVTVFTDGKFYPGRILHSPRVIGPGESGQAKLAFFASDKPKVVCGTVLGLFDGPNRIADARVIDIGGISPASRP